MIANCGSCGTLWTDCGVQKKVVTTRVPKQTCIDCRDFDWPVWTKRVEEAAKSLGGGKKKSDRKSK